MNYIHICLNTLILETNQIHNLNFFHIKEENFKS